MTANNENQANFLVTEDGDCYFAKLNISGKTVLKTTKEIDGVVEKYEFKVDDFTQAYNNCHVPSSDTLVSCEEELSKRRDFFAGNSGTWLVAAAPLSQMEYLWPGNRAEVNFYLWSGGNQYQIFEDASGEGISWWYDGGYAQIDDWYLYDHGFHCLSSPDYNGDGVEIQIRELMAGYRTTDNKNNWLYRTTGRGELLPVYLRYPLRITTNQKISSLVLPLPRDGKELGFFAYTLEENATGEEETDLKKLKPHRVYRMTVNKTLNLQLIQFGDTDQEGNYIDRPQNVLVYPIGSTTGDTSYASQQGYLIDTGYQSVYPIMRIGLAYD